MFNWESVETSGCTVEHDGGNVVLHAQPEGGFVAFSASPGMVGGVPWKSSRYLVFDAINHEEWLLGVVFRLWAEDGASGGNASAKPDMVITMGLMPQLPTRLSLPLTALDSQTMFMPRTPGKLKTVIIGERLNPERIVRLELGVMQCRGPQTLTIGNLRMMDSEPDYPLPDQPMVDELGQYSRKDWPGKTRSVQELVSGLTAEYERIESRKAQGAGAYTDRNKFGGWTGRNFGGSGFFRTHHDGTRWWLVDPDGAPFFSTGPDCVRPEVDGPVGDIRKLFEWLPEKDGEYADAWSSKRGNEYFDFGIANLIRGFGGRWRSAWNTLAAGRLREWGFNSIANWSDRGVTKTAGVPYVWPLVDFPTTSGKVFRDFPDVYSDEYSANAELFAAQLAEFAGDPLLIGYFLRNEPTWGFVKGLVIAEEVLATRDAPESRTALVEYLSEAYEGSIKGLNDAWTTQFQSFEELEQAIVPHATRLSPAAKEDLTAFSRKMMRRYVEIPSQACRRVDPHHLNLGMRYAFVADDLLLEGSDCFDVFSVNCYQMDPTEVLDRVGRAVELPVMIGEFHFGALDRGPVGDALRGVPTQKDRGIAFRYYLDRAAAHPYCVGAHYFTMTDQATLGRFDGENWNLGIEDICRRPYSEFLEKVIETHKGLYSVASGDTEPTTVQAVEVPRNAF